MNFFCQLFGHTWWPEIDAPTVRWNTTKDGHVLNPHTDSETIHHYERCKRCDEVREVAGRSLDSDRPTPEAELS